MNILDSKLPLDRNVEIMAIGHQPKDVEIGIGGILLKMAHRGYTTVICDLTAGDINLSEDLNKKCLSDAERATKILRVSDRFNLDLGDLQINMGIQEFQSLSKCICHYRPEIILAPYWEDWYQDMGTASRIVQKAIHLAKFKKYNEPLQPYTPRWIFYYTLYKPAFPQIVVNITSTFEGKLEAIKTYRSRSHENFSASIPFSISNLGHPFHIESRARHFGSLINCRFGEGLIVERPIPVDDIYEFTNI